MQETKCICCGKYFDLEVENKNKEGFDICDNCDEFMNKLHKDDKDQFAKDNDTYFTGRA